MIAVANFGDFEVIDASCGEKAERWDKYIMIRPDPQVIWDTPKNSDVWKNPDAVYERANTGGGKWVLNRLPESFVINYRNLKFRIKPMNFKHTGLFPEQSVNWDRCSEIIKNSDREISLLNLFAYTGAASVAAAKAGAKVCHVDASKGMTQWAKENAELNDISDIRFIVDDCVKFVDRELRRGKRYDAVIMDPPSYGRGPGGEVWKLESEVFGLLRKTVSVMSDKPLFFLLNSYTTGLSAGCMGYMLGYVMKERFGDFGKVSFDEIGLPVKESGFVLPCGSSALYTF